MNVQREAELPATGSRAAATRLDGLLATKLYMPGSRPGLVGRPRLLDRLDQAVVRDLILVCAPAGEHQPPVRERGALPGHLGM